MNLKETNKDLNPEIKKELEKSKFEVLTNENDFLVKNLKKAGYSTRDYDTFKLFFIFFDEVLILKKFPRKACFGNAPEELSTF